MGCTLKSSEQELFYHLHYTQFWFQWPTINVIIATVDTSVLVSLCMSVFSRLIFAGKTDFTDEQTEQCHYDDQ
jgi:hypothetical protein